MQPTMIKGVILASADNALRQRLSASLASMRWNVREAAGGAAAMAHLEDCRPEAFLLDGWLPDLEAGALAKIVQQLYPQVDLLRLDQLGSADTVKSASRHELLHAIREAGSGHSPNEEVAISTGRDNRAVEAAGVKKLADANILSPIIQTSAKKETDAYLPDLIGNSAPMRELARLVRLVAPHNARVLVEGETGSGKELVSRAVHQLSPRAGRPFVALNCAAIPETLLEAELFGHTRGAFTGAVQARVGRIEAADGGTLFLDEIGELPLALQAKLLRFLENGELQRIGGNETLHVDVRIVSATHQFLEERVEAGTFRLDLYHRLAVFPVRVPSLRERLDDLPLLTEYLLNVLGKDSPRKRLADSAMAALARHSWPGNVRELQNVLQRAVILSASRPELLPEDLVFGRVKRTGL